MWVGIGLLVFLYIGYKLGRWKGILDTKLESLKVEKDLKSEMAERHKKYLEMAKDSAARFNEESKSVLKMAEINLSLMKLVEVMPSLLVFGLTQDATSDELRSAFREAMKKYHPDVNPDADPEHTTGLIKAYNKAAAYLKERER